MGQLDAKVAIVTRADSGIGRAIALHFAQEEATVVVNYAHAKEKAQEVQQAIEQQKGKVLVLQADVSQYQPKKMAALLKEIPLRHMGQPEEVATLAFSLQTPQPTSPARSTFSKVG